MGKARFTTLDTAAAAACLRARLVGMRCTNVYDAPDGKVSERERDETAPCTGHSGAPSHAGAGRGWALPRRARARGWEARVMLLARSIKQRKKETLARSSTFPLPSPSPFTQGFLLRLSRSGDDGEKIGLLLEAGVRFHTLPDDAADRGRAEGGGAAAATTTSTSTAPPSGMAMKLRKHLRSRRLEAVVQLGCDRAVDFTFGSGDGTHHLLLELHSHGNVILCDSTWLVLTLLRSHVDTGRGLAILPAKPYPLTACVRARRRLGAADLARVVEERSGGGEEGEGQKPKKAFTLKMALAAAVPHGPAAAEHIVLTAGLAPGRVLAGAPLSSQEVDALVAAAGAVEDWIDGCEAVQAGGGEAAAGEAAAAGPAPPHGVVLLAKVADAGASPGAASPSQTYDSFEAFPLAQHAGRASLPFPTFDDAVSTFFGAISGQRAAAAQAAAEASALARVARIKADQARRAAELEAEADAAAAAAVTLEANLGSADEVITALRSALARGTSWADLERLIADEAAAGNPVAGRVRELKLSAGRATIALPQVDDGGDAAGPECLVEVDLSLGAHANARLEMGQGRGHGIA